jgi:hypothetical protein
MFTLLYLRKVLQKKSIYILFKHLLIVIFFALAYYTSDKFERNRQKDITNDSHYDGHTLLHAKSSLFDYFYFSLITQTTVGYAQDVPLFRTTKLVNVLHLMTILANIVIDIF